ncbi:hypothetical protein [Noviherbaspirillum sp.]|uniref:hypothetical protein n=1 Tax=Noviherbaspirillum sp. TaxID=1926288 RepID=UPI0039C945A5
MRQEASHITPAPRGVEPMTVTMLIEKAVQVAERFVVIGGSPIALSRRLCCGVD